MPSPYKGSVHKSYIQSGARGCDVFHTVAWKTVTSSCLTLYKIESVGLCVCSLLARDRIHRFVQTLACLFLETSKRTQEGHHSGKLSRVWVPVRAVPVARKLSTIEERRWDQSCLPRREDGRNKGHNRERTVLGSSFGEDVGFTDNNNQ
jgi:hypothetical protein